MTNNKVYEWGYRGDSDVQFEPMHNLQKCTEAKCVQMVAGLTFNMFRFDDGSVFASP